MRKKEKKIKNKGSIMPIGDKVLVKSDTTANNGSMSPSGIIIPDTIDQKQSDKGIVVAVGEGKYNDNGGKLIPMKVKKGDKVVFQWGDKIEYEGEEYFIVGEGNILAVIK